MMEIVLFLCSLALCIALASASAHHVNVHMIGHTHDDPGWLKTVDQYYTGSNQTVYPASVELIFDSVLDELIANKDKMYSFCEISFFSRWWREQTEYKREQVRRLVTETKQLVFLNGGWVMHDEAGAHYVSMIDQTTLGHEFLKEAFNGYVPKVGWQIDPFGHSNTHAWLSDAVGFDSLFFGRIDYQDMIKRKKESNLEFIWKGSHSIPKAQVFTGVFSSGNYGPPDQFCFDTMCGYCLNDPIVSDESRETYNLDSKVDLFIEALEEELSISRGSNLMMKMGSDMTWSQSKSWFNSVDRLIEGVNSRNTKFKLFWSNPEKYTLARAAEMKETNVKFTTKTDDFFPYADCPHCYWSGYFTSRPTLKYFERISSSFLQTYRQAVAAARSTYKLPDYLKLKLSKIDHEIVAAIGLLNHHDALTGTSKQHVAEDYKKIMSKALSEGEKAISEIASLSAEGIPTIKDMRVDVCRLAKNESTCSITQDLGIGDTANILVYNSLPRKTSQFIDLFIDGEDESPPVATIELDGKFVHADVISTSPGAFLSNVNAAPWTVRFEAKNIPALSSVSYTLSIQNWIDFDERSKRGKAIEVRRDAGDLIIESNLVAVAFDSETGLMKKIIRKAHDGSDELVAYTENDLGYYRSFGSPGVDGYKYPQPDLRDPHVQNAGPSEYLANREESTQPSGAYIFRPHTENEVPECITDDEGRVNYRCDRVSNPIQLTVIEKDSFAEVRQVFSNWAVQIVRIYKDDPSVELEWTVGPVPIDDNMGKEIMSIFKTKNLNSGPNGRNSVYTDSNGREFQHRLLNYRPTWDLQVHEPVAGNFYPITNAMYIKGDLTQKDTNGVEVTKKVQLSLLVDRAQAGASLKSGELEVMVHRRLLADDYRGVGEALNETVGGMSPYPDWIRSGDGITVSGKHKILLSSEVSAMKELRELVDKMYSPATILNRKLGSGEDMSRPLKLGRGLGYDLPINVHLLTLTAKSENTLLFRLAHQFAVDEDKFYSEPVSVDLLKLLKPFHPIQGTLQEWTLSHNQLKETQLANKIEWSNIQNVHDMENFPKDKETMKVTLKPMEIRTFTVDIKSLRSQANTSL